MDEMMKSQQDYMSQLQDLQDKVMIMSIKVDTQIQENKALKRKMDFIRTPPTSQQTPLRDSPVVVGVTKPTQEKITLLVSSSSSLRSLRRKVAVTLDGEAAVPFSQKINKSSRGPRISNKPFLQTISDMIDSSKKKNNKGLSISEIKIVKSS